MMKSPCWLAPCCSAPAAFAATTHWEYSGEAGPAKWASLTPEYGQCAGSNQSPVNLSGLVKADLAPAVPLSGGWQDAGQQRPHGAGQLCPGSTLELDGMHFELKQFHFHAPSENLIEGQVLPLEGHLVHANDKGSWRWSP